MGLSFNHLGLGSQNDFCLVGASMKANEMIEIILDEGEALVKRFKMCCKRKYVIGAISYCIMLAITKSTH